MSFNHNFAMFSDGRPTISNNVEVRENLGIIILVQKWVIISQATTIILFTNYFIVSQLANVYGLLLPKKDKVDAVQRPAVFDEESDSGGSATGEGDWLKKSYQREATKSVEKRQTKIQMQKALTQDPTIYQYDEVYEDIKEKTAKPEVKKEEKKTSRYIQSIKKNAERRKLENERRQERLVQKERIEEGEQFKDKETFVTSAYRKKLEEFDKMDEEERRMDYLEDIGDVAKQKDLSGFYRHLYKSTVDKDEDKKAEPTEPIPEQTQSSSKNEDRAKHSSHKSKRQYRKHNRSESSLEEGEAGDSDSCSSSSSSSSSSNSESAEEEVKSDKGKKRSIEETSKDKKSEEIVKKLDSSDKSKRIKSKDIVEVDNKLAEKSKPESKEKDSKDLKAEANKENVEQTSEPIPKVNIWAKRTVGAVFDDALKKFLERSATRQGAF